MKYQKEKLRKPFTVASKIMKYLGINLTEEIKDLYFESSNTLTKKTEGEGYT